MAENLLSQTYSYPYLKEGLHTKSVYLKDRKFNLSRFDMPDNRTAINICREREQALYRKYKCDSFEQFMSNIKNNFMKPGDAEVFKNFQYVNLTIKLNELAKQNTYENQFDTLELEIKIDDNVDSQIRKVFSELGFDKTAKLSMGVDKQKFKQILNAVRKSLGKKGGLHTTSEGISYATREIIAEIEKTGIVSLTPTNSTKTISQAIAEDRAAAAFPWGFRKADIIAALEGGDKFLHKKLTEAFDTLREFFTVTLTKGGSAEIKRAAEIVWEDKLGSKLNESISFFEKGNVNDLKVGAGGEYAAAMMFVYFDLIFGGTGRDIAKIAGDETERGMQGKIDVEAFGSYGIQVKNFNMAARQSSGNSLIKAGTNPGTFSKYLPDEQGEDLRLFFANYYFNKDFASQPGRQKTYEDVVWQMKQYFYALYNLALTDVLEKDQVSFYVIGSRYIVPASVIIETATQRKGGVPFSIKEPYDQKTDEELQKKASNYWYQATDNIWIPTEENINKYENYLYRKITIKSDIDYSLFIQELENSKYALY